MRITEQGHMFRIEFNYSPGLVEAVKALPDRRWDSVDRCWKVPKGYRKEILAFAQKYGFKVGANVEPEYVGTLDPMPELTVPVKLKMPMYHYQEQGVAFNIMHRHTIVGDQPGLGKTVQGIATVQALDAFPCIVICPATLKENWKREWHLWTDRKAMVLDGKVKNTWDMYYKAGMIDVFIVNYESLKRFFVTKIDHPGFDKNGKKKPLRLNHIHFSPKIELFKSLIVDESHRIKDPKTQQTKFVKGIAKGKDLRLLLTGTPIVNKPKDLVAPLGILDQIQHFGGYTDFVERYCSGPNEASNLRELGWKLRKYCFYQRTKKEVLTELPDKTRQTIVVGITNRQEYIQAENRFTDWLKDRMSEDRVSRALNAEVLVQMMVLRGISAMGKVEAVCEYIDDLLEADEKVVLFAERKDVISAFRARYPHAVSVTGSDDMEARQRAVDSFQTDPATKLILCSIKAAGVGLTLTASSNVLFVEYPWTPAGCDQCEDRTHRIGQKGNVNAMYYQGKDTIDERVYEIIQRKRMISNTVTGADDQIEESIVDDLVNLFTKAKEAV